jgi:DNA-binding MarR family transcriptional regulator
LSSYSELAAAIGLSRSRVSELIGRLEKEGLIEVRRTTAGRVRTATIRPAGLRPSRTVPVLGPQVPAVSPSVIAAVTTG